MSDTSKKVIKGLLVSDTNIDNLAGYLRNSLEMPLIEVEVAPFGQVMPTLLRSVELQKHQELDFILVWTRPESAIASFQDILQFKTVLIEKIFEEVDAHAELLRRNCASFRAVFIPRWVVPSHHRGLGMIDMRSDQGVAAVLLKMNVRLLDNLRVCPNIFILDTQHWITQAGKAAFNPKLWYMGKILFGNVVFQEAVQDIKAAWRGIQGLAKKLIIVDLDGILWGGVVGDLGWEQIRLGGHDYIGEAFVDFQRALKSMISRGIILGIVSKNEETIALETIHRHPEMALKLEDFAGWRINWKDKAQNVIELAAELNIGLESVVFLDDHPVERARVREALPEVFVPEWPEDPLLYKSALLEMRCFDSPAISQEDAERSKMYATERARRDSQKSIGSLDDWLRDLGTKVYIEICSRDNIQRIAQLFNKTNQMNLSTRRMTEVEILDWIKGENRRLWSLRVMDKFGDSGLTGIVSLEIQGRIGCIVDFILSCRVMGRKIEEMMLAHALQYARTQGLQEVYARYLPTAKNKPCLYFFQRSGLMHNPHAGCFMWNVQNDFLFPSSIEIVNSVEVRA